ncbi:hypothetical protein, partial [Serratia sp. CY39337]|uniref:hypothetical protein n=1 Tax=Serratia sp. CY39337 TaxID=3383614 RepID=UPI003FA08D42
MEQEYSKKNKAKPADDVDALTNEMSRANNTVDGGECRHGQQQRQHQHQADGVDAVKTAANAEQN